MSFNSFSAIHAPIAYIFDNGIQAKENKCMIIKTFR